MYSLTPLMRIKGLMLTAKVFPKNYNYRFCDEDLRFAV